jgi:hypothetical protein
MTLAHAQPLPFWGGQKCYACDCTKVVGFRDRRPEGHDLEIACERHADPTIEKFDACVYCKRPVRNGHLVIAGEFAHQKCQKEVDNDTFFDQPIPRHDGLPRTVIVGYETRGSSKLREELVKIVDGTGEVVATRMYAPDEGGGWTAVLGTEYAALKVYYRYRYSRVDLKHNVSGWVVSVRPPLPSAAGS